MNGSICRKYAARIILFNKLLEAHGKRCEMLWAEHRLCAHRTGGRMMDATPLGDRNGRKVCPDVEVQNTPHILALRAFVTALSPSVPTRGPFLSILTAKNQIHETFCEKQWLGRGKGECETSAYPNEQQCKESRYLFCLSFWLTREPRSWRAQAQLKIIPRRLCLSMAEGHREV